MKKNIWVERLGIFDIMALHIETLFARASVLYDEKKATSAAGRWLRALQRSGLLKNFHAVKLTLDKKDAAGYALNYRMENDTDACLNMFCDKYISDKSAGFKSAVRMYIAMYLTYRITFVTMVEGEREFNDNNVVNILYFRRSPFNAVIIPYYRKKGYAIRQSLFSTDCIAQHLKPFYRLWSIVLAKISRDDAGSNIIAPKPSVWVEYDHDCGIDLMSWRGSVDEDTFDIVYYLDRNDSAPLGEQAKEIEKKRLKWIDLHFKPLVKKSGIGARELVDMLSVYFSNNSRLPFWFRSFKFEFRMWRLLYEKVFYRFKVKVLIQHQECDWVQAPQAEAVEAAGGIMLGFNWSYIPYSKLAFWSNPQHVYFVWGKSMREWIEKRGNICRYVLPAGLWLNPEKGCTGKSGLKGGLKLTMAIFDSSVAYNIYHSQDTLDKFYLRVLDMIEKNTEWGGIVKSKNCSRVDDLKYLPSGKEIVSRAALLIKEGRLVFLDSKISPIAASALADISVNFGLNSAGIISGIRGHKAIHWDCAGWLDSQFYKDNNQKFLFATLDDMKDAVIKAYQGDVSIGDFSAWRAYLSQFDDDAGSRRIGEFINDFMKTVASTNDPLRSLDDAAKRYRDVNGLDDSFYRSGITYKDKKTQRSKDEILIKQ